VPNELKSFRFACYFAEHFCPTGNALLAALLPVILDGAHVPFNLAAVLRSAEPIQPNPTIKGRLVLINLISGNDCGSWDK
jgi:hypothetical protein